MGNAEEALDDAKECTSLAPNWSKGYGREGAALIALRLFDEAAEAYQAGLKIEPSSENLKEGLRDARDGAAKAASRGFPGGGAPRGGRGGNNPGFPGMGNLFGPETMMKIAANPKFSPYLADPAFRTKLETLSRDPNALQTVLGMFTGNGTSEKDPRMLEVIQFALSSGLGKGGMDMDMGEEGENDDMMGGRGGASDMSAAKQRAEKEKAEKAAKEKAEKEAAEEANDGLTPEERKEKKRKATEANAKKEEGNNFYKQRKFDEALTAYRAAQALCPHDITYLLNESAVHFELGDHVTCIQVCKKAIEIGRDVRAPFVTIAKVFARLGNAHHKRGELQEALDAYESSMLEHRTDEVHEKLKKVKSEFKKKVELDYRDEGKAEEAKERGNDSFKKGDFDQAIKDYSEAIKRNPAEPKYFTNRAAAKAKRMDWQGSLEDANSALQLDPKNVKAMCKVGNAQFAQAQEYKAIETFKAALAIEPESEEAKEGLRRTYSKIEAQNADPARAEERRKRAMADPEIQMILADPMVNQVLSDAQKDPRSLSKALQNAGMREKILKLNAAGIIQIQ
jgi:stress-induced-phosphoprotein 1